MPPPARTLTPGPSPAPSLPTSPGEGKERDEKDSKDTNDIIFPRFSPSSPGVVGREGAGEEGWGGEGWAGGRWRCLVLFAFAIACADARGSGTVSGLAPIRSGQVTLLVSPGDQTRPELVRLAADLNRAASEMAPRVPVTITSPVTVVVEPDYVEQGLHAGEIGEAVRGREADLHLVYNAADLPLYRYAVAGVLLARADLAGKVPIALEIGRGSG